MEETISGNGQISHTSQTDLLRSESVSEIISANPGFLIRYGISIIFFLLILIGCACWFIYYPDIISTKAKLTSVNAPKEVIAKVNGKLVQLIVKENDSIAKNEVIGFMESIADPQQVINLSKLLDSISFSVSHNHTEIISGNFLQQFDRLGELQAQYQAFKQAIMTFSNYLANGFYMKRKAMLNKDMTYLKNLHENLLLQKNIEEQDLLIAQKTFDINDTLKKQKVISESDYRNEKSKLLNKQISLPQVNAAIISNESQQNDKQKEILEAENNIAQQKQIFLQVLNTFISQTDEWKKKYLLTAPIAGKITFASFIQENQELKSNQVICFINPENSVYYAEIFIPQASFGKVKTGQQVLLKFYAYPFAEFGSINGNVDFISKIPTDSGYIAKVTLPNGLITNYNKRIQFRDGLMANGEIVTANMRLLQRFYYSITRQINSK